MKRSLLRHYLLLTLLCTQSLLLPRIVFAISSASDSPKGNLPMVDPLLHIEAESYNGSLGITKQANTVESTDAGDWIRFDNVNLGSGYSLITTRFAKGNTGNGTAQIRIGNPTTGTLLGTLTTVPTGGWGTFQNVSATLSGATGIQTLYVYWPSGEGNGNFDFFEFAGGSTDTTSPSSPTNLHLTSSTSTSVTLSWTASTDNVGVTRYDVLNNVNGVLTLVGTSPTNSITITNLAPNASYLFSVVALDASSNFSPYSNALSVTLGSIGPLRVEAESFSTANGVVKQATTVESTDAGDWIRFDVVNLAGGYSTITTRYARGNSGNGSAQVRLGTLTGPVIATLTTPSTGSWGTYATATANVTGGTGGQTIYITWPSGSGNGNFDWFEFSGSQSGVDTTPPTAPTNITGLATSSTSMSISWTASTDNVGVTEYQVYNTVMPSGNIEIMGVSSSNNITLSNLSTNSSYNISVLARDAVGNRSPYSPITVVTLTPATNIHLEAENFNGMNGILKDATVIESTDAGDWIRFDNVTLGHQYNTFSARYSKGDRVEGTTQIRLGSITGPVIGTLTTEPTAGWDAFTYGYATLSAPDGPQTLYVYWPSSGIRGESNGIFDSFDFFENVGGPDVTPPTTPTNLTLVSNTQNTVTLKWDPSSDNRSVRYVVYDNINQVFAQSDVNSATFTGLQATLPYVFKVRAVDGYSNFSGYSNPINVLLSNSPSHLEAESYNRSSGIVKQASTIESTDAGDWISFDLLDLGTGYSTITARYAKGNTGNGTAQIRLGNPTTGTLIGTLTTVPTGGWGTFTTTSATLVNSSGVQTVYVSWPTGEGNGNFDWFEFSGTASGPDVTPPSTPTNLAITSNKPLANLSWTPSTDNVGVTLYEVYNNGTELMGTTTSNGFSFSASNKWFTLTVRAKDAANNYSPFSTSVNFGYAGITSFHLEAEAFNASSGISKQINTVESTDAGDWIRFDNIFTQGYVNMQVRYAKGNTGNGKAEIRLGSTTGTLVGTITTVPTGGWGTFTTSNVSINLPTGPQTLYVYWPTGEGNGNFDWFEFYYGNPPSSARENMTIAAETPSPLSESPIEDEEVTENKLYQNFPNPFSGSTEIGVSLKHSVKAATITVNDLTGRSLQQVGIMERGNVRVKVEGNNMRAGIYIYSLMVDGKVVDMKRMAVFE